LFEKTLARFAIKELEALVIEPRMCLNVRAEKALCKRCLDVCPGDAISFNEDWGLELDVLSCQRCLLCTTACPNGAIVARTEQDPYIQAQYLLGRMVREKAIRPLSIVCGAEPKEAADEGTLVVPCIGCIAEDTLLLCKAVTGCMPTWKGCRKGCALAKGSSLWRKARKRADILIVLFEVLVPDIDYDISGKMTRRKFIKESGRTLTAIALQDAAEYLDPLGQGGEGEKDPTPGTAWVKAEPKRLHRLRSMLGKERMRTRASSEDGPVIDGSGCTACGACAAVCPTGALQMISGDSTIMILFDHTRCTECGGCKAICPERAMAYWGGNPYEPRKLMEFLVRQCTSCGLIVILTNKERAALGRGDRKVVCRSCRRSRD